MQGRTNEIESEAGKLKVTITVAIDNFDSIARRVGEMETESIELPIVEATPAVAAPSTLQTVTTSEATVATASA